MERARFNFSYNKTNLTNERQELIQDFVNRLNEERRGTSYAFLSPSYVAFRVSHLSTEDLRYFLKECKRGLSFGKVFFGALKVKKNEN